MSIKTKFSDSSSETNICFPYMMSYDQPPQNYMMGSNSINED